MPENCWKFFLHQKCTDGGGVSRFFTVTSNFYGWSLRDSFTVFTKVCSGKYSVLHTVPGLNVSSLILRFLNFLGGFCVLFSGAVYLEGGLEESRQLFGRLLFNGEVTDSLLLESNLDSVLCHRTRCVCACVSLSCVCTHLVLERSCGHTRQDFPIFGLCKTNCNIFANLVSFIRSNPHTACFGKVPHIARY